MVFKIRDGRDYFYQWDIDREILVLDDTINEVHFCNRTDDCSLVVNVEELEIFADDKVIDVLRFAKVPNILLQDTWKIKAYAYYTNDDGKYTKVEETFTIKPRSKPSDYVYTETEVKTYTQLEERIDEIEKNGFSEEVVNNAVNDYFEKNPIEIPEVDLTGYATEQYVQDEIANIDIPDTDLSNYYTKDEVYNKTEVDQKISEVDVDVTVGVTDDGAGNVTIASTEIGDTSNYYTKSEVDQLIDNIDIPETNLDNYYTKNEVDTKLDDIKAGDVDLSNYYTKGETDSLITNVYVPSKVSELANDKGYISSIPDMYVTEDELNAKGYLTEHQSLDNYYTKGQTDTELIKVENIAKGRATGYVFNTLSDLDIWLADSTNTSKLVLGDNLYIKATDVPDYWWDGTQKQELETQKVSLDEYYTKEETDNLISEAGGGSSTPALSSTGIVRLTQAADGLTGSLYNNVQTRTATSVYEIFRKVDAYPYTIIHYSNPVTSITNLELANPQGVPIQFVTGATCTCTADTSIHYFMGDDCGNGVFTPQPNTKYEVVVWGYNPTNSYNAEYKIGVINYGSVS